VVVTYDMGAAAYDPETDGWTTLPSVPARFSEWLPLTVSSGGRTVTTMAAATAVLGDDDRWTPLPHGPLPVGRSVALDPPDAPTARVATWVVDDRAETSTLVVSDLDSLVAATPRRQVGQASIELADGDELREATRRTDDDDVHETVALEVDVAEGGSCAATSTSTATGALVTPSDELTVDESLPEPDNPPREWSRDDAGRVWETTVALFSLVRIECGDPAAARRLAGSLQGPPREG
jgi:hypothetical protein